MDPETARKISELAANLKKLHLAATMEEAHERAKEMILGHKVDTPIQDIAASKSIGELHAEMAKKSEALEKGCDEALEKGESASGELKQVKAEFEFDKRVHELEKSDSAELKEDIRDTKKKAEEIKDIVEEADYVQEHSKEEK